MIPQLGCRTSGMGGARPKLRSYHNLEAPDTMTSKKIQPRSCLVIFLVFFPQNTYFPPKLYQDAVHANRGPHHQNQRKKLCNSPLRSVQIGEQFVEWHWTWYMVLRGILSTDGVSSMGSIVSFSHGYRKGVLIGGILHRIYVFDLGSSGHAHVLCLVCFHVLVCLTFSRFHV